MGVPYLDVTYLFSDTLNSSLDSQAFHFGTIAYELESFFCYRDELTLTILIYLSIPIFLYIS